MRPIPLYFESLFDKKFPFARLPATRLRKIIRRKEPGGQEKMFLNLCRGLAEIGVPFEVNRYSGMPETVGLVGKAHVLPKLRRKRLVAGPAIYSHPEECRTFLSDYNVARILVPGPWMKQMCEPYWRDLVHAWPVGIDTKLWNTSNAEKKYDVLIYDKIMWRHNEMKRDYLLKFSEGLRSNGMSVAYFRYGHYKERHFYQAIAESRAMIFACEHETQGLAYLQTLSSGVPILAWDEAGYWQDPQFYPAVQFSPVSSVPYWDDRCGMKVRTMDDLADAFGNFWDSVCSGKFDPRGYVTENLTLSKCAAKYVEHFTTH
jgi:hypothetical protein